MEAISMSRGSVVLILLLGLNMDSPQPPTVEMVSFFGRTLAEEGHGGSI